MNDEAPDENTRPIEEEKDNLRASKDDSNDNNRSNNNAAPGSVELRDAQAASAAVNPDGEGRDSGVGLARTPEEIDT